MASWQEEFKQRLKDSLNVAPLTCVVASPMVLAFTICTWLILHYLHGWIEIGRLMNLSSVDQPGFILNGRIYWHAPFWVNYMHIAVRWLYESRWGGKKWIGMAIWALCKTGVRVALIFLFWSWIY